MGIPFPVHDQIKDIPILGGDGVKLLVAVLSRGFIQHRADPVRGEGPFGDGGRAFLGIARAAARSVPSPGTGICPGAGISAVGSGVVSACLGAALGRSPCIAAGRTRLCACWCLGGLLRRFLVLLPGISAVPFLPLCLRLLIIGIGKLHALRTVPRIIHRIDAHVFIGAHIILQGHRRLPVRKGIDTVPVNEHRLHSGIVVPALDLHGFIFQDRRKLRRRGVLIPGRKCGHRKGKGAYGNHKRQKFHPSFRPHPFPPVPAAKPPFPAPSAVSLRTRPAPGASA